MSCGSRIRSIASNRWWLDRCRPSGGLLSWTHPDRFALPMAVVIPFGGASASTTSQPHWAMRERTDALVAAQVGPEATIAGDRLGEGPLLAELRRILRHALGGSGTDGGRGAGGGTPPVVASSHWFPHPWRGAPRFR